MRSKSQRSYTAAALALLAAFLVSEQALAQGRCRLVQLTDSPWYFRDSLHPQVSSDGRTVAFDSEADLLDSGEDWWPEIFTWSETTGLRQITSATGWQSWLPSLGGDGSTIAFESNQDPLGTNTDHSLEIFLWGGSGFVQITNSPGFASIDPSISRDGSRVAFTSTVDFFGTGDPPFDEIFLWDAVSGLSQVTRSATRFSQAPSIAADGRRIAFESTADPLGTNPDESLEIFLWDETAGLSQITDSPAGFSQGPVVNDDGSRIAFYSNADLVGSNPEGSPEIFLWDEDSGLTQVTSSAYPGTLTPALDGAGRRIAFVSQGDLLGTNADGSFEVFLATCPAPSLLEVPTLGLPGLLLIAGLLATSGLLSLTRRSP